MGAEHKVLPGVGLLLALLLLYLFLVEVFCAVRVPLGSNISVNSVTLSNGLELLLLSEPAAVLSTVSLAVPVGSYHSEIPGLAHLVEHLVVSRSVKYPEQDYFTSFLTKNGGKFNAFTDWEETNFYFEVKPASLEEALSIFASYFAEPLISSSSIEAEVQAVNSEHQRNFLSERWQGLRLLQLLANQAHPLASFTTGSSTTFAGQDLVKLVRAFIATWYTGGGMKVVVYSGHSLADLLTWTTSAFSAVPPGISHLPSLPHPFVHFGRVVLAPLDSERQVLKLYWPLPPQQTDSLHVTFLSYMLGIPTGLKAILRSKGSILDLSSQVKVSTSDVTILSLELHLTSQGLQVWQDTLQQVADYAESLAALDIVQAQALWDFYVTKQTLAFEYHTEMKSGEGAAEIAGYMLRFPKAQYLTGSLLPRVFDWPRIRQSLVSMPSCLIAVLRSGQFTAGNRFQGRLLRFTLRDAAYELDYDIQPLLSVQGKASSLALPSDSVLWPIQLAECESCPFHPTLLGDSWFFFDRAAALPYASVTLLYRCPDFSLSGATLGQLLAQMLTIVFEEVQAQDLSGSLRAEWKPQ